MHSRLTVSAEIINKICINGPYPVDYPKHGNRKPPAAQVVFLLPYPPIPDGFPRRLCQEKEPRPAAVQQQRRGLAQARASPPPPP